MDEGVVAVVRLGGSEDELLAPFWNYTRIGEVDATDGLGMGGAGGGAAHNCSDHNHYGTHRVDLTYLLAAGGAVGVLVALWLLYRAYHLLLLMYCRSLTHQCIRNLAEVTTSGSSPNSSPIGGRIPSPYRSARRINAGGGPATIYVIESSSSCRSDPSSRAAGVAGMAAVLARMQNYRKGESPPPPYDPPPPYHVAVTMEIPMPDIVMSEAVVI